MSLSPNHEARDPAEPVRALVLHYTGMRSAKAARDRLCDPQAKVSAHYLVDEDGSVECLVDEDRVAWHAGVSAWQDMIGLNRHSIGIEIVNPGHQWGYRAFPDRQLEAVRDLAASIIKRHRIDPANLVGHSDIAPARKEDPGELFPWREFASAGLGLWPEALDGEADEVDAAIGLITIGYRPDQPDTEIRDIVRAFQRRFRPRTIDGRFDWETMALIRGLAHRIDPQ